jgi:hypothetical protein
MKPTSSKTKKDKRKWIRISAPVPLLESDGMISNRKSNMEVDVIQCRDHEQYEMCRGYIGSNMRQRLHCQCEADQRSLNEHPLSHDSSVMKGSTEENVRKLNSILPKKKIIVSS